MRRVAAVLLALLLAALLWAPLLSKGSGTLGGSGVRVTRWGVLGFAVVTTHLSWYAVGDVPVDREVDFSWPLLAATVGLSVVGSWPVLWLWRRRPAGQVPATERPRR